ncbi:hypothetical protein FBZ90_1113 [Nitrospirillum pindoramense]|uniref:Uncharacterized protein n=1 Tax=Nitrospirillum amazonense TaxID=28077 RepID=A0A560GYB1_9PROT|nr:hypothetical protein FBZ90_1113 [Nitrospirillum amazonense]
MLADPLTLTTGLIEDEESLRSWGDVNGDFLEMAVHRGAVAAGHDDAGTFAHRRADRTEDPG